MEFISDLEDSEPHPPAHAPAAPASPASSSTQTQYQTHPAKDLEQNDKEEEEDQDSVDNEKECVPVHSSTSATSTTLGTLDKEVQEHTATTKTSPAGSAQLQQEEKTQKHQPSEQKQKQQEAELQKDQATAASLLLAQSKLKQMQEEQHDKPVKLQKQQEQVEKKSSQKANDFVDSCVPSSIIPCVLCQTPLRPEGQRTPYLLECGHILCAECLRNVSSINDASSVHQLIPPTSLKCSDCFCMSSLPLSKHYPLIRTFIKQISDETADIVCKVCHTQQAVIECTDCRIPLCEECDEDMHNSDIESEEHVRELIDLNTLCLEHCKAQQVYCISCSVDVCQDCVTRGTHSQHHYQLREDLVEEQNHSLSVLVSGTESNLRATESLTQQLQEALPNKAKSKNIINKAFEDIHAALHLRRQDLLKELDDTAHLQTEQCELMLHRLADIKKDCNDSMEEFKRRLSIENTENSVVGDARVIRKNAVIPPEEYDALISRFEKSNGHDVSAIGQVPNFFKSVGPAIESNVLSIQASIAKLGTSQPDENLDSDVKTRTRTSTRTSVKPSSNSRNFNAIETSIANEDDDVVEEEDEDVVTAPIKKKATKKSTKKKQDSNATNSIVHLGRQQSGLVFSKLKVGDKIDCLDSSNRWAEAEIVEICKKSRQVLVTYLYWGKEWDEWVTDVECGIAPLKSHTYYAGGPLEIGFRVEVLHDGVWREGFIMETKGEKVKVYYEDFSNTTQQKWVDFREDCIRQFGLYSKDINDDHDDDSVEDDANVNTSQNTKKRKTSKKSKKEPTLKKRKRSWKTDLSL